MTAPFPNGSSALPTLAVAAILLSALPGVEAWAAIGSTEIESPGSSWESSGSGLKLPQEGFGPAIPIKPDIRLRLSSTAQPIHTMDSFSPSQQF